MRGDRGDRQWFEQSGSEVLARHAYSARDKKLHGINASGWAPAAWTPEYFRGLGFDETTGLPEDGLHSIKGDPRANGVYRAGSDLRKDGQAVGW